MRFFHYTTVENLPKIIKSGRIRRARESTIGHERPLVWISTNLEWEHSAMKAIRIKAEGMPAALVWPKKKDLNEMFGLGRIEISGDLDLLTWSEAVKIARIPRAEVEAMVEVGRSAGADPDEWRACVREIHQADWISIEVWDGSDWIPHEPR